MKEVATCHTGKNTKLTLYKSHGFIKYLSSGDKSVKMNYCCQGCFLWKVVPSALRSSVRLCLLSCFPQVTAVMYFYVNRGVLWLFDGLVFLRYLQICVNKGWF